MKVCTKCKEIKDFNDFYSKKASKDGFRSNCKTCYNKSQKLYDEKNSRREYHRNWAKKNYQDNKLKIAEYQRTNKKGYYKKRSQVDPLYKLIKGIRCLITNSFNYRKPKASEEILGCSFIEFKMYIESKFEPWMTWENRGRYNGELNYGWDLDHIIPISSAKSEEDIIKLNHFSNFSPLCSKVNRDIKKDSMEITIEN